MAQEFHISVTPLGEDEYLVRIERVAPGVPLAEEQVSWPVEDWLIQARQLMNDPLLGLLQGNTAFVEDIFFLPEWEEPVSQSSLNLVALGQQLYNALFQGSLRDSWMMAQAIAQNQRQVLRLRLGLKGTRLPRLPWEVLHAGDRPLATGTDVAFSRYQLSTGLMRPGNRLPSQPHQPLKILMVIAGPSDQESLELVQEASHLQEELKSRYPNEPPAIQLTILEQPGREQLTQALEQGQYQVFHYAGHSNLGDSGGDVYLVSNKTGLTETLNGDDLAGLLVNNGVQLAVFNSCRGAYTAASDSPENGKERNLAEALVKRGIPGVLAMAERIPDEVALTLTRLLYRNLNQGYPIDLSLSRARQGLISAYGSNQLYWALPVLYLHPEFNGFLSNDDATRNREELFALPEPPEMPLQSKKKEAPFTTRSIL
ncbi:MAG: CHAT domain-containing protein, partial [Coleofasciculus sp. C3-bin4]|nr:CHAT domain-containing protein [Coleofasciculus sp. C3-bin4]